jgi:hypothetical protein
MNKRQIIIDFLSGNYGWVDLETEFKVNGIKRIEDDKRLMNTLDRLHIKYKLIDNDFWDGMPVRYFGAFCCLKELTLRRLNSNAGPKEDLDYLKDQFHREEWL